MQINPPPKIKNNPQNKPASEINYVRRSTSSPSRVHLVRERYREDFKMNGKRVFALVFAITAAIAVNVALFGSLYLLVNP